VLRFSWFSEFWIDTWQCHDHFITVLQWHFWFNNETFSKISQRGNEIAIPVERQNELICWLCSQTEPRVSISFCNNSWFDSSDMAAKLFLFLKFMVNLLYLLIHTVKAILSDKYCLLKSLRHILFWLFFYGLDK
jgi:hypothetical protein